MDLSRDDPLRGQGLLYPMLVIAAIAVIVFSIVGIATISGWLPHSLMGDASETGVAAPLAQTPASAVTILDAPAAGTAFKCAECGVVESVREIERRSAPMNERTGAIAPRATSTLSVGRA